MKGVIYIFSKKKKAKPEKYTEGNTNVKNSKDDLYIIRKNNRMKFLRMLLWIMICFIFLRGVVSSLKLNSVEETERLITNFKNELNQVNTYNSQIFAFTEQYAYEYLTYDYGEEDDYKERLSRFTTKAIPSEIKFNSQKSEVVYCKAYKVEEYSQNQADVYVYLEVKYTTKNRLSENNNELIEIIPTVLKIPVAHNSRGNFIIEDLPLYVNDSVKMSEYAQASYTGNECIEEVRKEVTESLNNFLKAYYEESAGVISYYLDDSADTLNFIGLNGRVEFVKINSISVYQLSDEEYKAIVEFTVKDVNELNVIQHVNILLKQRNGQYYVVSMDTRNKNIK